MRKINISTNRAINWFGSVLSLVGLVYTVNKVLEQSHNINYENIDTITLSVYVILVFALVLSNYQTVYAWKNILAEYNVNVEKKWVMNVYGVYNLSKYIPGNVFQFIGRHAIGMSAGIENNVLVRSAVWELVLILIAATMYIPLAISLLANDVPLWVSSLAFLILLILSLLLIEKKFGRKILRAFGWHIGYMLMGSITFAVIFYTINNSSDITLYISLCGAYAIAWISGLITPGAPAGIGIREFVLLFILNGLTNDADIILVVVISRILTMCADIVFYIITRRESGTVFE